MPPRSMSVISCCGCALRQSRGVTQQENLSTRKSNEPVKTVGSGYASATINHNLAVLSSFYADRWLLEPD